MLLERDGINHLSMGVEVFVFGGRHLLIILNLIIKLKVCGLIQIKIAREFSGYNEPPDTVATPCDLPSVCLRNGVTQRVGPGYVLGGAF